jgi:hypothetical protein
MPYRQLWGPLNHFRAQKNECIAKRHKRRPGDVCPRCWAVLDKRFGGAALQEMRKYVKHAPEPEPPHAVPPPG